MNFDLGKIIKKAKKIKAPNNAVEMLLKQIENVSKQVSNRELTFLSIYYGFFGKALTLEAIGQTQENALTRERVRQIIDAALVKVKNVDESVYKKATELFKGLLLDTKEKFIREEKLLSLDFFNSFGKNLKGLIAFLNDCGIRQVAYRKKYYFYLSTESRRDIVKSIQSENKAIRKTNTLEKMKNKAKTVTYVPKEVRNFLLINATEDDEKLNSLYEKILGNFINKSPYKKETYEFPKTKSWQSRKGKAEWEQVGIYIEKNIFEKVKEVVKELKKNYKKRVSLMAFICQAFTWYAQEKGITVSA